MDRDRLSAIEHALVTLEWAPSHEEAAFGAALLYRRDRLEGAGPPGGLPPSGGPEPLWLTQVLSVQADLVRELDQELLPLWRERLGASPMLVLVDAYVEAVRPLLPVAARLVAAWRDAPATAPTGAEVLRWAADHSVSPEEAAVRLNCEALLLWEDRQLTEQEMTRVACWQHRVVRVGAVLEAAVTTRP
ncbi:hypothetical protein ACEZCY_30970 [Streptacidiphilus sp. N1-12]|uniref:Uncharacterized protein n=2 Tax=Streptacidiphilus alkalitolerans TaxID=3342712 RepID=A0ABV6WNI0_9ACTN